jgi:polysaccharide export outer membrane protein
MRLFKLFSLILAFVAMALPAAAQDGYKIRPGDKLAIEVVQDPSLNRTTLVLPDGRFSFPPAGTLSASGRTIGQVQGAVASAIQSNFSVPVDVFVSVEPAPVTPRATGPIAPTTMSVYFLGEIGSPGPKELPLETTLLQALSTSGGFTNFAATKRVQLRRTNPTTGLQSVFLVNYDALANGAELRNDLPLQDGDVILVPERRLFE